jgi:RNA polymerase-binding protein DksA
MDREFVTKMEGILIELKNKIFEKLAIEDEEFREIFEDKDPKDLADIAADDIDKNTLEALEAQDVKRLNLIDSALSRIKNGKYGICMSCSEKIPKERLEAIPYALLCIECKTSEERKSR